MPVELMFGIILVGGIASLFWNLIMIFEPSISTSTRHKVLAITLSGVIGVIFGFTVRSANTERTFEIKQVDLVTATDANGHTAQFATVDDKTLNLNLHCGRIFSGDTLNVKIMDDQCGGLNYTLWDHDKYFFYELEEDEYKKKMEVAAFDRGNEPFNEQ